MTSHCAHGAASVPAKGVGRGCARKLPLAASASGGTCAGPGEPEGLHPRDHVGQTSGARGAGPRPRGRVGPVEQIHWERGQESLRYCQVEADGRF